MAREVAEGVPVAVSFMVAPGDRRRESPNPFKSTPVPFRWSGSTDPSSVIGAVEFSWWGTKGEEGREVEGGEVDWWLLITSGIVPVDDDDARLLCC